MHFKRVASVVLACQLGLVTRAQCEESPEGVCTLASAAGLDPVDAQTAADLVCAEVKPVLGARYRVRLARLEHKIVLGLTELRPGAMPVERHLVLGGFDEITTAAPRLAESITSDKPVVETQNVDNVVAEEARKPVKKPGEVHAWLGVDAVGFVGASSQARGGVDLGIGFGSSSTSFVLDGRLAGESLMAPLAIAGAIVSLGALYDENRKRVEGALGTGSAGIRQYLTTGDTAPFLGGGIGLGYMAATSTSGARASGTGVIPYVSGGLDVMRTRTVGGIVGARFDLPLFGLEGESATPINGGKQNQITSVHMHPMLLSMFLAVRM